MLKRNHESFKQYPETFCWMWWIYTRFFGWFSRNKYQGKVALTAEEKGTGWQNIHGGGLQCASDRQSSTARRAHLCLLFCQKFVFHEDYNQNWGNVCIASNQFYNPAGSTCVPLQNKIIPFLEKKLTKLRIRWRFTSRIPPVQGDEVTHVKKLCLVPDSRIIETESVIVKAKEEYYELPLYHL